MKLTDDEIYEAARNGTPLSYAQLATIGRDGRRKLKSHRFWTWATMRDELRALEGEAGVSGSWPFGRGDYARVADEALRARLLTKLREMLRVAQGANEARVIEMQFELIEHLISPQFPPYGFIVVCGVIAGGIAHWFPMTGLILILVVFGLLGAMVSNLTVDRPWIAANLKRELEEATKERDDYRAIYAEEWKQLEAMTEARPIRTSGQN